MGTGLLQPIHLLFLLVLALLLFGAKRLPEIGRSLGVGMREFKESGGNLGAVGRTWMGRFGGADTACSRFGVRNW
jgi:TatA/E family protein of Tat protein translocase